MSSRLDNSIRNIKYSIFNAIVIAIIPMVTRTVFINCLGKNYLGIDAVFINIVNLLEIVNIGIGTAITYSVYQPIASGNVEKCKTLFRLYKRCYWVMGSVVGILGICIIPFFNTLLKNPPQIKENLILIYLIILFGMVSGYFFADKQCVLIAHQKNYIISKYRTAVITLINVVEIVVLWLTRQYILYLIVQTLQNFIINLLVYRKAVALYPYIQEKKVLPLAKEDRVRIVKNTSALVLNRAGSLIISGTDNLVLSSVVGVTSVGLYSNYFTIKNCVNNFTILFTNQIGSSIGNFLAQKQDARETIGLFEKVFFANYFVYSICSICLALLFQPFITLWIGTEYLLRFPSVLIIVANFYFLGMQNAIAQFKAASGLYWQDRYRVIVESIINLVSSVLLAKKFGVSGVFLGTLVSYFLVSFWVEPKVVCKNLMHVSPTFYYKKYVAYTGFTIIAMLLLKKINDYLPFSATLPGFLLRAISIGIADIVLHIFVFWRHKDFRYLQKLILNRVLHR